MAIATTESVTSLLMVMQINFFHHAAFDRLFSGVVQAIAIGQVAQILRAKGKPQAYSLDLFVRQVDDLSNHIAGIDVDIRRIVANRLQGSLAKIKMELDLF